MVKKIQAFMSSDGQLFDNELAAVKHDAELTLMPIFGGNVGIVDTVIKNYDAIYTALSPINRLHSTKIKALLDTSN